MKGYEFKEKRTLEKSNERGMTIVELVVALAISSILALIAFQFFTSVTSSFGENREAAEMQQELRWGMNFLSDHIKLTGNGIPPTCGWPIIEAVNGSSGESDSLKIMGCFKSLLVNTTQTMGNNGSQIKCDSTEEIEPGDLCVISDGTFTEIFMVTSINSSHLWHAAAPPWNDDNKLDHRYASGSSVQVVTYYQFYIDTDDDGRDNLVLKHHFYDPQILVGDVEDFQVRFKMKNGQWIDEPDQDEIDDIRMVELKIISKSPNPIQNYEDPDFGDAYKRIEMESRIIPKNLAIL